jgi:hypothetical protein
MELLMAKRHFGRGQSTFICTGCGKRTRDVGDNGSVELCELCFVKAGAGNTLSDHGYPGDAWAVFDNCKTVDEVYDLQTTEMEKLGYK